MKLYFLYLFSILTIVSSCKGDKVKHETLTPTIKTNEEINNLIDSCILFGDTNAYQVVRTTYFISNRNTEFLNYALLMANKYEYDMSYFDVYFILTHPKWGDGLERLDKKTRLIALYYLTKSYRSGYYGAIEEVELLRNDKYFQLIDSCINL